MINPSVKIASAWPKMAWYVAAMSDEVGDKPQSRQICGLLNHPGRRLLKLNIDAGGARSRLLIDRTTAQEEAPVTLRDANPDELEIVD